jgi:hypothetical protein
MEYNTRAQAIGDGAVILPYGYVLVLLDYLNPHPSTDEIQHLKGIP